MIIRIIMGNYVLPETTLVELRCAMVAYTPGNSLNSHGQQPCARMVLSTFYWNLLRKVMEQQNLLVFTGLPKEH